MYYSTLSVVGTPGYWDIIVPVACQGDMLQVDADSILAGDRSTAHFKPVRHSKADGLVVHVSKDEWQRVSNGRPNTVFFHGHWTSPTVKGYSFWMDKRVKIPHVPASYRNRITGCVPTCFRRGQAFNGVPDGVIKNTVYWAKDGGVYLFAYWTTIDGVDDNISWGTSFIRLNQMKAEQVFVAPAYNLMAFNSRIPKEVVDHYRNLTVDIIDGLKIWDGNGFEFLSDVNAVRQIVDVAKLALSIKKGAILKDLSSLYLSANFGALNTLRDYRSIADSISDELSRCYMARGRMYRKQQARGSLTVPFLGSDFVCHNNMTAYVCGQSQDTRRLMNAFKSLDSIGLYPDRAAVWELVPFSFVLDWFSNLGDILQRRDAMYWRQYYDIAAVIGSYKLEGDVYPTSDNPDYLVRGGIHISLYNRFVERELPQPVVDLDVHLPHGVHQWVTGAALVVQKRL